MFILSLHCSTRVCVEVGRIVAWKVGSGPATLTGLGWSCIVRNRVQEKACACLQADDSNVLGHLYLLGGVLEASFMAPILSSPMSILG
jgi:hypothetical protein